MNEPSVYPFGEDQIGSYTENNYIAVSERADVRSIMKELIRQAADCDNISTIYAVDDGGILVGTIDLKQLIMARKESSTEHLIAKSFPSVFAEEPIESCMERLREFSADSIPVLDGSRRLLGVLTPQRIGELLEQELEEDYAMLAGLSAEEDLLEPLRQSIGKRLPWLMILLGLGFLVSFVVGLFESVVAHLSIIVSFQSLILGMSGNVGTQSLAVTIRVLSNERLSRKQRCYLIGKEARVGLVNGLLLGTLSVLLIGLYLTVLKCQSPLFAFSVSLCTGAALVISTLLSAVSGTVIPMIFKRLNIDPAVASGPLITTVNDLVAVLSYYGLSWLLLIRVLGLS